MAVSGMMKPSCARVLLPLLTLGFPLGVVLVVVLRLPVEEIALASTDMRLLQGFSTFWCGWQEVTSTHPFVAYKVPQDPPVQQGEPHVNSFAFRFTLMKGRTHLLRYHLLPGSSLDASGCASQGQAEVKIAGGEDDVIWCWKRDPKEDSSEEGDSSEEVSYSQKPLSPEIHGLVEQLHGSVRRRCPPALTSSKLELIENSNTTPTCLAHFDTNRTVNVTNPGLHYVIVSSRSDSVNHILLHVRLNRSSYELPDNMILCRSQSRCEIPLSFGTQEKVVVFMAAEPDAGSVVFPVRSKCKPRVIFYLVVFLVLPLMFAIALAFVVRTARRKQLSRNGGLTVPTSVATVPLLEPETGAKPQGQMTPPPPYRFVSELPPPYESVSASAPRYSTTTSDPPGSI